MSQAWTAGRVAPTPRMERQVPPGRRFNRQNVIRVTPIKTGIACRTRLPIILMLGERDKRVSMAHSDLSNTSLNPTGNQEAAERPALRTKRLQSRPQHASLIGRIPPFLKRSERH